LIRKETHITGGAVKHGQVVVFYNVVFIYSNAFKSRIFGICLLNGRILIVIGTGGDDNLALARIFDMLVHPKGVFKCCRALRTLEFPISVSFDMDLGPLGKVRVNPDGCFKMQE